MCMVVDVAPSVSMRVRLTKVRTAAADALTFERECVCTQSIVINTLTGGGTR